MDSLRRQQGPGRDRSNSPPDCEHLVRAPENLTGIHVGTGCRATLRDSRGAQGLRRKRMPVTGRGFGIPSLAG